MEPIHSGRSQVFQRVRALSSIDPRRAHIDCPLLVLHGGHDVLFDLDAQRPFLDGGGADTTLQVWQDGDHTIYNRCHERTSFVADWFADKLTQR